MSQLTIEDIKKIAKLSKLELSEEELKVFESEFNSIVDYISSINEVDVSDIQESHNLSKYEGRVLQEDNLKESLDKDKALLNATNRSKSGYIKTSKIVTKD